MEDSSIQSSPESTGDVSSVDSELQELMSDPNYLDGTNAAEHRRLVDRVQDLYHQRSAGMVVDDETNMPVAPRDTDAAEFDSIQSGLVADAKSEMEKLGALGFKVSEIKPDIFPHEVDALRTQRLLNEGSYAEAGDLLKDALGALVEAGVSDTASISSTKNLLDGFLRADYLDPDLKLRLGETVLNQIYSQQNQLKDQLLSALEPKSNVSSKARMDHIRKLLTPALRKSNDRLYNRLFEELVILSERTSDGYLE